ncbi:Apolipoprotein [Sparganum proliferum]
MVEVGTPGDPDDGDDDVVGLSMLVKGRESGKKLNISETNSNMVEVGTPGDPDDGDDDVVGLSMLVKGRESGKKLNISETNSNMVEVGTPGDPDDGDDDVEKLRTLLRNCAACTRNLIELLVKERAVFMKIHKDCLIASTVGTSVSTFGTILSVLGLIGIPITLGSSLMLTGVGATMVTAGAATSIGTSVARGVLNNNCSQSAMEVQSSNFKSSKLMPPTYVWKHISYLNTAQRINEAMEKYFECSGQLNDAVQKLSTNWHAASCARLSSEAGIAVLRANWTFFRRGLTDLLKLFEVSRKAAYVTSVKFLGAMARALSFIGVALQAVEIASLVNEWNAKHPQAGAVDEFIQQLRTKFGTT